MTSRDYAARALEDATTFAIQFIETIQATHPEQFQFSILDMSRHRLAYCPLTNILSDSGALQGVSKVPEGEPTKVEGLGEFTYENGVLSHEKTTRDGIVKVCYSSHRWKPKY